MSLQLKEFFKKKLSVSEINAVRKYRYAIKGWSYRNDLTKLAIFFGSDKWGKHYYTPHYQIRFKDFKQKKINLLEIGVGGNKSKVHGGASLRMWKNYFRNGKIFGIDIHDKSALQEKRIKIFQGDQANINFLDGVAEKAGPFDIIIDDGSHRNDHIITSFINLFPHLNDGGIYVVEDVQTSYWEFFGGSSQDLNKDGTAMNFFKSLVDGVNHSEYILKNYQSTYLDENILSLHFYHNLIFIYKGDNTEPSSFLKNNQLPGSYDADKKK
ncbi:class I SAM-dependent methyltransferase [Salegentibacter agarivorans]